MTCKWGLLVQVSTEYQADKLAAKVKHYLITTMGRTNDEANDEEFYRAFSFALREEIMINWLAAARTRDMHNVRMLYYLSMEYLPGRVLSNNITNICSSDLVYHVMKKLNRSYRTIMHHESDPGLGNGGLGRLASCFLDSLATHHYPAMGYGLRYQYGIFEQQIINNEQVEAPDCWLLSENPWEFRRDLRRTEVKFCGHTTDGKNIHGDTVQFLKDYEEVKALPFDIPIIGYSETQDYSVVTLRLWTTKESPRNFKLQRYNAGRLDQAAENTTLTDVLYPTDYHEQGKRTRIKQEFLLVSASLQDIIRQYLKHHENFDEFGDKVRIQINDTHPALAIPELIRILTKSYEIPWRKAIAMTQETLGYTNHTVLSEALERWDQGLIKYLLPRQYRIIEQLNQEFCDNIRNRFNHNEEKVHRMSILEGGQVHMAHLAILGSHCVNGVAKLHGEILRKETFKDFCDVFPDRFTYVTNGVTQRRWLLHCNPALAHFISDRVGRSWVTDFSQLRELKNFASDPASQELFLQIKRDNKVRFLEELSREPSHLSVPDISIDSLFDVHIKRFHEYKRQLMNALHIIMLYQELKKNPDSNRISRTFIFGGKAAASYVTAKHIIQLICCLARKINRDPDIKDKIRVLFVENYNVSKAEMIIPAADLSEQISTAGMEASGTGNMKLSMNGALTIGTQDGANIEMHEEVGDEWWPFSFGSTAGEILSLKNSDQYHSWDICAENPQIHEAVEALRNRTFAETEQEHQAFCEIYDKLLKSSGNGHVDQYFVLKDLKAYYETQKRVEELYKNPNRWAEFALQNIAGMANFSTDRSIEKYAKEIWGIKPLPVDQKILEKVRQEYSEHDQCRIY